MSVGMPQGLMLHAFGSLLWDVFGHEAYHVGSSLRDKSGWRDVDVRVMLPDSEWESLGLGDPENPHRNAKWCGLVLAFSELGKKMTGLPIDFQIQQMSHANKHDDGRRSALVVVPHRFDQPAPSKERTE